LVDYTAAGSVAAGQPEVFHYLRDVLGSIVGLTNASGTLVERYTYDPYGKTFIETWNPATQTWSPALASPLGNPFFWTGQRYDPTTATYHFWARTYSPVLGRWLQQDPLGYIDSQNLYAYVAGMPLTSIDPTGQGLLTWVVGLGWNPGKEIEDGVRDEFDRQTHDRTRGTGDTLISHGTCGGIRSVGGHTFDPADRADGAHKAEIITTTVEIVGTIGTVAEARIAAKAAETAAKITENAMARGVASEARVQKDMGLAKNTTAVTTAEGKAIPDALTEALSVEVKDTAKVSLTKQLRIQTGAAAQSGKRSVLITGEYTKVSKQADRAFDMVIRRLDLGPPMP